VHGRQDALVPQRQQQPHQAVETTAVAKIQEYVVLQVAMTMKAVARVASRAITLHMQCLHSVPLLLPRDLKLVPALLPEFCDLTLLLTHRSWHSASTFQRQGTGRQSHQLRRHRQH